MDDANTECSDGGTGSVRSAQCLSTDYRPPSAFSRRCISISHSLAYLMKTP
jgi:hypothetical protein